MRTIIAMAAGAVLLLGADGAFARAASSHPGHAGNAAMKSCASQWQAMKKAGTAKGSYQDFSKTCMAGKGEATSTAAAPAASSAKPAKSSAKAAGASVPAAAAGSKSTAANTDATGATAKCKDGTYSHAKTHSGACSRHGGVAEFLK